MVKLIVFDECLGGGLIREAAGSLSTVPASAWRTTVHKSNAILVSHRQKGNPLLKHIRNVRWNFADLIPDYVLGQNSCALYLKFGRVWPILGNYKGLREQASRYHSRAYGLGLFIKAESCSYYYSTCNKTDVVTLGSTFGSLAGIMDASMEDLARCPGIGERKVKLLYDTVREPFKRVMPSRPAVPEAVSQSDPMTSSSAAEAPTAEKEAENASKFQKKEPELTIKSALSEAFAKYSGKLGKKSVQSEKGISEGSDEQPESEPDAQT